MLVLDDRTEVEKYTFHRAGEEYLMDIYELKTRYGLSTREVTVYHELGLHPTRNKWDGDIIAFGEWWDLDEEEIEQVKKFLEEKGYLSNEGRNTDDTQQPIGQ